MKRKLKLAVGKYKNLTGEKRSFGRWRWFDADTHDKAPLSGLEIKISVYRIHAPPSGPSLQVSFVLPLHTSRIYS